MALVNDLMRAPDVSRFVQTLRDDLSRRKSVFLLLPAGIPDMDVWLTLYSLIERDFDVDAIDLAELDHANPAASLGEALQRQRGLPALPCTLTDLASALDLPDVLYLSGLAALPPPSQRIWLEALSEWARQAQRCRDGGASPMALCVLADASGFACPLPEANVFLSVRWWWNIPSAMDVHGLCRLHNAGAESSLLAQWREHLLPALAGPDALLADSLWDSLEQPFDVLTAALHCYGLKKGWHEGLLKQWECDRFLSEATQMRVSFQRPPEEWRDLWAKGLLSYTPEYGCELHSAALAVLDRPAQISHRIWRGQAALLMPLIDRARLRVCEALTDTYGCEWPLWKMPQEEYERQWLQTDPLSCQLGHLKNLLYDCFDMNEKRRWLPLVQEANQVRKSIAHYRAVTFEDYKRLAEALNNY